MVFLLELEVVVQHGQVQLQLYTGLLTTVSTDCAGPPVECRRGVQPGKHAKARGLCMGMYENKRRVSDVSTVQ